ncbi:hypothetical protein VCHC17A2_1438B, partial [Vibrio cholerae HC-17A2]
SESVYPHWFFGSVEHLVRFVRFESLCFPYEGGISLHDFEP